VCVRSDHVVPAMETGFECGQMTAWLGEPARGWSLDTGAGECGQSDNNNAQ